MTGSRFFQRRTTSSATCGRRLPAAPFVVTWQPAAAPATERNGEDWAFYEIDPDVVRIARDPRYFRFLSSSGGGDTSIVLGDAG